MAEVSDIKLIISEFLKDTPPGEIKYVIEDLKVLLEGSIENTIDDTLKEQIISDDGDEINADIVELPDSSKFSIISKYNLKGTKFYDSVLKKVYNVQFLKNNAVIDVEDYEDEDSATKDEKDLLFELLVDATESYYAEHYPSDKNKSAYEIIKLNNSEYVLIFLNVKYNPSNFINGKWVSVYHYDYSNHLILKASIYTDVHYFEDGNVRFKRAKHLKDLNINGEDNEAKMSDKEAANSLFHKIKTIENEYLFETIKKFNNLNEQTFKNLRRLLPVTREKINWGRAIGNYSLGKDAANSD